MKSRPKEFLYFAISMASVVIGFPLQIIFDYGYGPMDVANIVTSLAPLNIAVMALAAANACIALLVSRALVVTLAFYALAVGWNNWVVAESGLNANPGLALLSTLLAWAPLYGVLRERPRHALFHPEIHWWKTAPRRKLRISVVIRAVLSPEWNELKAETFDVSTGGAFIELRDGMIYRSNSPLAKLKPGALCTIRLMIDQVHVIQCSGEVVRTQTQSTGEYPRGIAVRFHGLQSSQQAILNRYVTSEVAGAA